MEEKAKVASEVNRLYWQSGESVAEIATRLNVSRRALYEAIEPLPSGSECHNCGAELFFSNRSAKTSGVGRCVVCGTEREIDSDDVSHEDVGMIPPDMGPRVRVGTADDADDNQQRAAAIAGFAIAGAVAGAIATVLIRRSR